MSGNRYSLLRRIFILAALAFFVIFSLAPFAWMVLSSFMFKSQLLTDPFALPPHFTLDNYARLFTSASDGIGSSNFIRSIINSLVVCTITTVIALVIGSVGGYAFARLRFPGQNVLLLFLLAIQFLPAVTVIIPMYMMGRATHLLDSWWILIFAYTSFALPFALWILRGYFMSIPRSLENAARIDGCSRLGAFIKVVLPLSAPGLAATAIFTFLNAWDEFFFALIFTDTYKAKTLPVALSEFTSRHSIDFGLLMSGGVVANILPVIIALSMQGYIVRGLTAGGVKG
ncbi:MAG TPA: carbohydrate ABC transporter permease [Chloroflexota bacterium]|nr:carbohydrate ABC transporter permease [Chloroflexota bacterium]